MKAFVLLLLTAFLVHSGTAQSNELLVQKKSKTVQKYFVGHFIMLETINNTYADGIITRITKDSIFIQHFDIERAETANGAVYIDTAFKYTTAVHYMEIGKILFPTRTGRKTNGTILMVAGGGVMVLGAVNGLYRGDPPKDWYKTSSYIVAGALAAAGFWLRKTADKKYTIGKKYHLKILELSTR